MANAAINIIIGARDAASGVLASVGQRIRGFASSIFSVKGLLLGALGGYGIVSVLRSSLAAWGIQEQAAAKLAGTLRATGGAAGYTSEQLQEYAAQLQKATTFGDETIINAQAILATFKEIKGDVFKQATEAMLDMSAVLGQDLQSSAVQLGKALNDPIRGVTALRRVGVSFTEAQLEQIKVLTESGKSLEAQGVILDELKSEFGGVARAMGQTGTGAMQQFKNAMGDVSEKLGKALTPALVLLADLVSQAMPYISKAFEGAGNNIGTACAYIKTALDGWGVHMDTVKAAVTVFVDTVKREFKRLHSQAVQDTSSFFAKFYKTAEGMLTGKTIGQLKKDFDIIDQSYRNHFSPEAMAKLTDQERKNLKAFEEALEKSRNQFELDLPKNLERFKFKPGQFQLNMPQDVQDTLDAHAKALTNKPMDAGLLTRMPGSSVSVSTAWDKNEKRLADLKTEARKTNTLLDRILQVTRERTIGGGERIVVYAGG